MSDIIAETEIFPIKLNLEDFARDIAVYEYKVQAESHVVEHFGDIPTITFFAAKKVDGFLYNSKEGPSVITSRLLTSSETRITLASGLHLELIQSGEARHLNLINDRNHIFRLLYKNLRTSFEKSGFKVRGNSAFDTNDELLKDLKTSEGISGKIAQYIGVYAGFYFRIREVNNKLFLQITPKSTLEFKVDLYHILSDSTLPDELIEDISERVRFALGGSGYLAAILPIDCQEPIHTKPFRGMSFLDYQESIENTLRYPNARLLVAVTRNKDEPFYVSSEGTFPILDFTALSRFDQALYSLVNTRMKNYSARRRDLALKYAQRLSIFFGDSQVKLEPRKTFPGDYHTDPMILGGDIADHGKFYRFQDPIVSFRDDVGNVKPASKGTNDRAAPQDLLSNKGYRPYSVPQELKVSILAINGLDAEAQLLRSAILNLDGRFLDIQKALKCRITIDNVYSINADSISKDFPKLSCDCAIAVGPKDIPDSFGHVNDTYTSVEVALLQRGIPAQYVMHSPSDRKNYDHSVSRLITNNYALFGLGLSLIAKVGGNSMILSPETTKDFPANSVVIGYNVARVFEHLDRTSKQSRQVLELTKSSIPISAAVSIMDESGSEILHQYPHIIPTENALFNGDRGQMIIDQVPDGREHIIIHKDGMFSQSELEDIRKLKKSGTKIVPVSIVTSNVPRLSTSIQINRYLPKAGMIVPLSNNEFILSTTLVPTDYDPMSKGWPNPLQVKIDVEDALDPKLRKQILFQIWALTRSHPASSIPTRRPMSIHYSNKMAKFVRKARDPEPSYFKEFASKPNRFGFYAKPFL